MLCFLAATCTTLEKLSGARTLLPYSAVIVVVGSLAEDLHAKLHPELVRQRQLLRYKRIALRLDRDLGALQHPQQAPPPAPPPPAPVRVNVLVAGAAQQGKSSLITTLMRSWEQAEDKWLPRTAVGRTMRHSQYTPDVVRRKYDVRFYDSRRFDNSDARKDDLQTHIVPGARERNGGFAADAQRAIHVAIVCCKPTTTDDYKLTGQLCKFLRGSECGQLPVFVVVTHATHHQITQAQRDRIEQVTRAHGSLVVLDNYTQAAPDRQPDAEERVADLLISAIKVGGQRISD